MTPEEYWARIKRIPLYPERESTNGRHVLCRNRGGDPVLVAKPDGFTPAERLAIVETHEMMHKAQLN